MPSSKVDRRRGKKKDHLAAAADYIAKGDDFYLKAADEVAAWLDEDAGRTQKQAAEGVGKSIRWVQTLLKNRAIRLANSDADVTQPIDWDRGSHGTKAEFERTVAEKPERVAEAIEKAPPEAKRKIAEQVSKDPDVRAAARKRDIEDHEKREPEQVPPRDDSVLFQFESKLVSTRRLLREAIALVDQIDQPGDDEDIIETLNMIEQLAQAAREAYTSGKSLDTWAQELYERSA